RDCAPCQEPVRGAGSKMHAWRRPANLCPPSPASLLYLLGTREVRPRWQRVAMAEFAETASSAGSRRRATGWSSTSARGGIGVIRAFLLWGVAALAWAQPPEFVTIPAGSFVMGCEQAQPCSKTLPKKLVTIERPFQLSKYEVTVGQFRTFVKATGYLTDAEKAG